MLTYKYKYQLTNNREYIGFEDFYVSPDLSYISGTTSAEFSLSVGDKLWVESAYFPRQEPVVITDEDTVKRNGYILHPVDLLIQYDFLTTHDITQNNTFVTRKVKYVEYNGDVYYQDINDNLYVSFLIEGRKYSINEADDVLTIQAKAYIEDDKVVVDGITYNVIYNQNLDYTTFTDILGVKVANTTQWDKHNINLTPDYVQKVVINNQPKKTYNTRSVSSFGIKPFIVYNDKKLYLQYLYNETGTIEGFGVIIDGVHYPALTDLTNVNPFSRTDYQEALVLDRAMLFINDVPFEIIPEPVEGVEGGQICVEMEDEHLSFLLGDVINLNTLTNTNKLRLNTDSSGVDYIYLNNKRYSRIANLCDEVVIQTSRYQLTYDGDCAAPYIGMMCNCTMSDGSKLHFTVAEINTELNTIVRLQKVKYENNKWMPCYTMRLDDNGHPAYLPANDYPVETHDGIKIGNYKFPIVIDDNSPDEVVYVTFPISYELKIVETLGSNKFICEPNINRDTFKTDVYDGMVADEIIAVTSNDLYVVTKMPNLFGVKRMTAKDWIPDLVVFTGPTSMLGMSGLQTALSFERKNTSFSIPVSLSKPIDGSLNISNLITSYHYDEQAELNINRIVDMDKDIYTPIIREGNKIMNVERITFNLHFRTRDLETWQIHEDEGIYNESPTNTLKLAANSDFCNWFITDYYPYNQYNNSGSTVYHNNTFLNNCMKRSDLLGYLYFTTNDVQEKRRKLTGSFLRLTFFDSKNPEKQNMLGTSTIFMDCDRHYETLYSDKYKQPSNMLCYNLTAESLSGNRFKDDISTIKDGFSVNYSIKPNVLTDCFMVPNNEVSGTTKQIYVTEDEHGYLPRLDSRLVISDRYTSTTSSEGFYTYIIKEFADRLKPKTVYMKAEFFHAGVGVKIPMVLATDRSKNAIKDWDLNKLNTFKEGYELSEVYDRLYIPITISYNRNMRQYVYEISNKNNYLNSVKDGNNLIFNLFELKTKAQ